MISGFSFFVSHYPAVIYKQYDINKPEYEPYLALYLVNDEDIIMPLHLPTDLLDPSRPIPCNALFGKYYPYGFLMHGYEYVPHISVSSNSNNRSIPLLHLRAMTSSFHRTRFASHVPSLVHAGSIKTPAHQLLLSVPTLRQLLLTRIELLTRPSSFHSHTFSVE